MIYQGKAIQVEELPSGIARLTLDLPGSSVNVFNHLMLEELRAAVTALAGSGARALICRSAKPNFLVGADIKEFTTYFKQSEADLLDWCQSTNAIFNALEDLPMPTITTINGMALGGGLEMCLATDYRIAAEDAILGFPEVNLGICPGFGGTVRAPRLFGAEQAAEMVRTGRPIKAQQALSIGAVDVIAASDMLEEAAVQLVDQALSGEIDYQASRQVKLSPLALDSSASDQLYDDAIAQSSKENGPNYPAAVTALQAMRDAAGADRAGALILEHTAFVTLARSDTAGNLVQLFLNDQFLKAEARKHAASASTVKLAAVVGAGIMGGGISYQSALKGTPVVMKDIAEEGLSLGMGEASKQLSKLVQKGRLEQTKADQVLNRITPTLNFEGFAQSDIVIEAVVENTNVKQKVLAEVEEHLSPEAVLTSNTSTISISLLASSLRRPENFCGMHFFNPVPLMPLVEVIRGEKSSEKTISTTVNFAQAIGKTPIVVNDCPGFLVNRILFPYFGAFCQLLRDGADFRTVDKAMEDFGWPMGPAYLLDVVGIDTASHAQKVMAEGFPQRMSYDFDTAIDFMYESGHYGQKNGKGFYTYIKNASGRPEKVFDDAILTELAPLQKEQRNIGEQEIVERMMLSMCLEAVRCLEDGIVSSPIEVDMGLLLGLGFPRFRGGALRYIDNLGAAQFCAMADKYRHLGALYHPTEKLRTMAAAGQTFY